MDCALHENCRYFGASFAALVEGDKDRATLASIELAGDRGKNVELAHQRDMLQFSVIQPKACFDVL